MTVACEKCGETIEFHAVRPRFCGHCGSALTLPGADVTTAAGSRDAPTVMHTPTRRSATGHVEAPPERVAGYRLVRELGRGGMGTVYEAEESSYGRKVALKLLAPEITASPEALERFRQEGRLASAIAHPRCVFVLNADEDEGRPYIIMELMPGSTLQDLVTKEGPLPVETAIPKILDIIEGLREAHRLGLIHRDVKPSNCFLEADGRVKVGDFGLSKSLVNESNLTRTGSFLGTPLYASPEQIKGDVLDARTDVYSVAATLYYLLAGRAPFQGSDAAATLAKIVSEPCPPIRSIRPEISAELERILLKGLERNRDRRYRDLGELYAALLPFAPGRLQIGGLGLRIAAFALEVHVSKFLFITLISTGIAVATAGRTQPSFQNNAILTVCVDLAIFLVAFLIIEPIRGASPAKLLLGLRVRGQGISSPGPRTILVRNLIFWGIAVAPWQLLTLAFFLGGRADAWWMILPVRVLGLALVASTMRASNGYAGLHDLLTRTRVVSLPRVQKRRTAEARRALGKDRTVAARPVGVLRSVGPYTIRGAVRWDENRKVLAGEDSTLGREVWIVLRPRTSPPPDPARRDLTRATRPRWLSGGEQAEGRWDAYIAPAGCPLADLAGPEGLSWRDARPIFEDLADELHAALRDGTLPEGLTVDQVWIQPDGRAMLVDQLGVGANDKEGAPRSEFDRSRAFLRETAALALMGGRRLSGERRREVRTAIPFHAREILDRLGDGPDAYKDLAAPRADLAASQDHPVEVGRPLRLTQVGAMSALMFFLVAIAFGLTFEIMTGYFAKHPVVNISGGAVQLTPSKVRTVTCFYLALTSAVLVVSTIASRGGVVLSLTGCGVARRDGLKASRLRCAWRTLLVWGTPMGLLAGAIFVQGEESHASWPSGVLFILAAVLVVSYPFLALVFPVRGPHDRLSGTVVVPK